MRGSARMAPEARGTADPSAEQSWCDSYDERSVVLVYATLTQGGSVSALPLCS